MLDATLLAADTGRAMPQENVEVVYRALSAMEAFDHRQMAVFFPPDTEWHNTSAFPGPRVCVGPDAIMGFWEAIAAEFRERGGEIEQVSDVGGRVVVGFHSWGSGRASGAPIDARWAAIFEVADERIVRVDVQGDYAKALKAAALPEQAMSRENVETVRRTIEARIGATPKR
jgi:ketosteroid isomerase-like protein